MVEVVADWLPAVTITPLRPPPLSVTEPLMLYVLAAAVKLMPGTSAVVIVTERLAGVKV